MIVRASAGTFYFILQRSIFVFKRPHDFKGNSLPLKLPKPLKRKYGVYALRDYSKRTYGFLLSEKRRALSEGMKRRMTFQKELHFVQIFLKSHSALDYLIVFQIVFLKRY